MRGVHDAIQDGVGEGRIIEPLMPGGHGQLARDQGGAGANAVIEQLQQVAALGCRDRGDGEVVDGQYVDSRELSQAPPEAAVAVGYAQFFSKRGARV